MKRKTIILILVCTLVISALCGCAGGRKDAEDVQPEKHTVVLTERQKQILRKRGLAEEYDQLTDSQKNAIVKIERVLTYLEDTYHDEFEYEGDVSGGLDGEYVTARITDTYPAEYVTVDISWQGDHYEYSDNYREIMAEPEYAEQVTEFLTGYFDPSDFQVYVKISRLKEAGDSVVERAVGIPDIMINGVYSEDKVKEAAQAYAEWIAGMAHKDGGGADFRIYQPEDFRKIDAYSYREYFGKDTLWLCVNVDSDQSVEIKEYRHDA